MKTIFLHNQYLSQYLHTNYCMAEFNQNSMWPPSDTCATHSPDLLGNRGFGSLDLPRPNLDDQFDNDNFDPIPRDAYLMPFSQKNNKLVTKISPAEFVKILSASCPMNYDRVIICDCRYPHEFKGGHILGAFNIIRYKQLFDLYTKFKDQNVCVIFHCEFSQNRGPTWAQIFRKLDRDENMSRYPNLSFPDVFVLEGGYKKFYKEYPQYCIGGYTPMDDDGVPDKSILKRAKSAYEFETRAHLGLRTPPCPKRANSTIQFDTVKLSHLLFFNSQPSK